MEIWLAIKMILGNKRKIIFPLLAVISGITALIITLSISRGGKILIDENLSSLGENRILIGGEPLSRSDMKMIENYPFVEYTMFPNARVKQGDCIFIGCSDKALRTLKLNKLKRNEVIIDKNQYENKNIGDEILLNVFDFKRKFIIKDIYEEKNPFELMKKGYRIIVSQSYFEELFHKYSYQSMIISFKNKDNPEDYVEGLIKRLKNKRGSQGDLKLLETPEVYKKIIKIKKMINRTLGLVAFVSLALGAFGILNLIGNNIKARSKHIGILKAMGMNNTRIVKVFILEAIIISIVGSIIGIVLGIIGSLIIGSLINIRPIFNIFQISCSLALSLGIGITMGIYPTRKINKENVINILKGE